MTAFSKLLVLLAIFLLTSQVNACMILSLASGGKQVRVNHLIKFDQPMNKPTCEPISEVIKEQMNDQKNVQMKTLQTYTKSQIGTWQSLLVLSPE